MVECTVEDIMNRATTELAEIRREKLSVSGTREEDDSKHRQVKDYDKEVIRRVWWRETA